MLHLEQGTVIKVLEQDSWSTEVLVLSRGRQYKAFAFLPFTNPPKPGDRVVLNTTALDLGLGSGGYHFLLYNESNPKVESANKKGHIMKLRYTPLQFRVLSVEEEASPHHSTLAVHSSLEGIPVVIGLLHSHLAPAILALNWASQGKLRIAYMMTDGGALPLSFSRQVKELKNKNLLAGTITCGHAFGGDLEAVNSYSGLLAAKWVLRADIIIVAMGPGIAGTNTQFGFSGIEQGQIANAVTSLGGRPVMIPRVSFADSRPRHFGLSHHSQTILGKIVLTKAWVGLPLLPKEQQEVLWEQIDREGLDKKHTFIAKETSHLAKELSRHGIKLTTMGRSYGEDPVFFQAAWASGLVAWDLHGMNRDVPSPQCR